VHKSIWWGAIAEGAAWNEEESDSSKENQKRFASRGALGDGTLPFTQGLLPNNLSTLSVQYPRQNRNAQASVATP
jgi:hypothetical protein